MSAPPPVCSLSLVAYDCEGVPDPSATLAVTPLSGPEYARAETITYAADSEGRISFPAIRGMTIEVDGPFPHPPLPQRVTVPDREQADLGDLMWWPALPTYPPKPPPPPTWASLSAEAAAAGYTLCIHSPGGAVYLAVGLEPTACLVGEVAVVFEPGLTFTELQRELDAFLAAPPAPEVAFRR